MAKRRDEYEVEPVSGMGDRIREAREAQGINQSQLAQQLGVEQSHVSKWENDRRIPRLPTLVTIGKLLCVSLDFLVLGRRGPGAPATKDASAP